MGFLIGHTHGKPIVKIDRKVWGPEEQVKGVNLSTNNKKVKM